MFTTKYTLVSIMSSRWYTVNTHTHTHNHTHQQHLVFRSLFTFALMPRGHFHSLFSLCNSQFDQYAFMQCRVTPLFFFSLVCFLLQLVIIGFQLTFFLHLLEEYRTVIACLARFPSSKIMHWFLFLTEFESPHRCCTYFGNCSLMLQCIFGLAYQVQHTSLRLFLCCVYSLLIHMCFSIYIYGQTA